jgi:multiple sugar transport system substrate-binding protein
MSQHLTRREFIGRATATGAGLASILASGVPPARGQQREISYLCWNNFAPASDKKLAEIGQRFTKDTGIKIRIDHIAHAQQAAKYAAEVQTQAGHDLVEMRMHFPWLYEPQLVEVSDLVAELEKKYGKPISSAAETANVNGVWRAVPQYHAMFVAAYREDLFKKGGLKVPETWEDLYVVGKELKKMGHPIGIPISQNYDSISTAGPVLWSFGGMEVDKDGKTVRINSPATEQMLEWYRKIYRDCMEPEVLSWTDASNNESLQQGKAGWIHNPVSAYIVAKQKKLPSADGINHHRSLAGPQGRHETDVPRHIGIWKFSKNVEPAKEWIRYLLGKKEVYDEYVMSGDAFNLPVYEKLQDHAVLKTDAKYANLKGEGVQYHTYGWPAPPSDKVQQITNLFILPNLIAKAVTGASNKEAIVWAETEMKKIIAG